MFWCNWNNKRSWTEGREQKNVLALIMTCLNKWTADDLTSSSVLLMEKCAEPEGIYYSVKWNIWYTGTFCMLFVKMAFWHSKLFIYKKTGTLCIRRYNLYLRMLFMNINNNILLQWFQKFSFNNSQRHLGTMRAKLHQMFSVADRSGQQEG